MQCGHAGNIKPSVECSPIVVRDAVIHGKRNVWQQLAQQQTIQHCLG